MFFHQRRERKHGIMSDIPVDGSRCAGCAADCCRGFLSVALTPEEYALLQRLGARRLEFTLSGRFYLIIENGCEFLREDRCSIYESRPTICRRFTCSDGDKPAAGR